MSAEEKAQQFGVGPQAQDGATKCTARERGCDFPGHYRDIGLSGYDPNAERKELEPLLDDCRADKIHQIVVFSVSRFSYRRPKGTAPFGLELFTLPITIMSCSEGVFTPNNTIEPITLLMRLDAAHNAGKTKSEAISGTKRVACESGGRAGGTPPYGFESRRRAITCEEGAGLPLPSFVNSLRLRRHGRQ